MSNCEKYFDMISAYADDELNEAEKAELEAHLAACEECRSILETYREISAEMALDTEEVPEGFSDGVMNKVASYEKNINARKQRRNLGIAGRWIGIAACIAIVLVAFPRMPHLGCGASKDAAMENATSGAAMDAGADFDMLADGATGASPAEPESAMDYAVDDSFSYTDTTADSAETESEDIPDSSEENALQRADIGMVVTLYGEEIPEELLNSEYEVTYYSNGDIEYIVPVSVAREISERYNCEIDELDTDIDGMTAKIIITK